MPYAFATTLLWSLSAITARRLVDRMGSTRANFVRLLVAALLLAVWALAWGRGFAGRGMPWFVLSGVVGFGIGDTGLYFALPRLGSRLSLLMTQCLAAPIGAVAEWLWLGTTLSCLEILLGAGVIGGVVLALAPADNLHIPRGQLVPGIGWGLMAAVGQGLGAVISRRAFGLSLAGGVTIDGGTAAFQRILGGLVFGTAVWLLLRRSPEGRRGAPVGEVLRHPRLMGMVVAACLFGPVGGVACYQWALATAPSGLVLAIVALCPVVIVPFSMAIEGDRPQIRSLVGGALAVGCAITLALIVR